MTPPALVSWDLDGTLYTRGALLRRLFLRARFADLRAMKRYHREIERQRGTEGSRVDAGALTPFLDIIARERALLVQALGRMGPSKRALARIAELARLGVVQVVLSDFPAHDKLAALGLSQHFTAVYDCQSLGYWKPSAVPFAFVQRAHGVTPDQHLHIGDRADTDGEGARRSGCRFELV